MDLKCWLVLAQAEIPTSIVTVSGMHLLPGYLNVFVRVEELMPAFLVTGKTRSVNMQPLCCSQCVVKRCSQTPKHVLIKLYDCTYCLFVL